MTEEERHSQTEWPWWGGLRNRGGDETGLLLRLQRAPKAPEEFVKMLTQAQEAKVGPTLVHF